VGHDHPHDPPPRPPCQCQACYCRDDWQGTVVFDGPFYDYTDGVCPAGHRHLIDD
jgi:hypothetical protein